ncbi:hypothetical protein DT019_11270 [Streptomyces sp. SDr-06]|uniref:hypothetical protein n=1 Tax=Streptomyces sp. SDr-06 TaxID=2267702 RepID=UPI000DE7FFB5|nr:hypothetical protein [Streptomyces sp. SDr-06]RCH68359.1 hypothetical protein DT019_11270 [Streptomyces sp. SDr-06]
MHSDTHLLLHHLRAAELEARARATLPREARDLRIQLGWILVELGLRLTQGAPHRQARLA